MEKFSFGVLAYNQESIVIETLESIKYQIVTYGKGICFNLIITDDCSKDNTPYLIRKWVEDNKDLFSNVWTVFNEENKGTVYNYNTIMSYIENEKFKVIAADDLIGPVNIFLPLNDDTSVIDTFPYYRLENGIVTYKIDYLYDYFYKKIKYNPRNNLSWMKKGDFLHTPSTFYSKQLYMNSDSLSFNSNYYLYEDDPTFYSFFKKYKNISVRFHDNVIILYRYTQSSTSTIPNNRFLEDWKRLQIHYAEDSKNIEKIYYLGRSKMDFSKRINLYKIIAKLKKYYRRIYVLMFYSKQFKSFKKIYISNIELYQGYYNNIEQLGKKFLHSIKAVCSL